jgi:hypothetical protein
MSGDVDFGLCGPVYGIAQREAVELVGETPVVTDPGFLLKMDITAELTDTLALLLFTKPEYAAEFLAAKKDPALVMATFRGIDELIRCVADPRCPWVMLNRIPGRYDGSITRSTDFIETLRRWMAGP